MGHHLLCTKKLSPFEIEETVRICVTILMEARSRVETKETAQLLDADQYSLSFLYRQWPDHKDVDDTFPGDSERNDQCLADIFPSA